MEYEKPAITDLGSITDHTFNNGNGNGWGPLLKGPKKPKKLHDAYDEPSHS